MQSGSGTACLPGLHPGYQVSAESAQQQIALQQGQAALDAGKDRAVAGAGYLGTADVPGEIVRSGAGWADGQLASAAAAVLPGAVAQGR